MFALQDRVSEQLAARLRIEVDQRSSQTPRRGGTSNPQAYEAYLKGRFHLGVRGYNAAARQNSDAAIELFERAIAMDAGFQSLGPFNRAFKATTGVTPTEYRRLKATAA